MTKKIRLDVEYIPEFEVIGIFSSLKDYRLCWIINNKLSTKFQRTADVELTPHKSKNKELFSLFEYKNTNLKVNYYLLKNRGSRQFLLPEHSNIDYLMLLKANEIRIDIDELITKLRNIPQISTAVWFKELDKIKNLNDLLYEFELTLIEKPD